MRWPPDASRRLLLRQGLAVGALLQGLALSLPRRAQAAAAAGGALTTADWDAAFGADRLATALQALKVEPVESPESVSLRVQDLAENGAAVPVLFGTVWPEARWLLLAVERNPNVLSAAFELQDPALEPHFDLRIKMAETSAVLAIALDGHGHARYARREVTVILGSCVG